MQTSDHSCYLGRCGLKGGGRPKQGSKKGAKLKAARAAKTSKRAAETAEADLRRLVEENLHEYHAPCYLCVLATYDDPSVCECCGKVTKVKLFDWARDRPPFCRPHRAMPPLAMAKCAIRQKPV